MGKHNDWYTLKTPMVARDLEECLLGVAVENPHNPRKAYTPDGPENETAFGGAGKKSSLRTIGSSLMTAMGVGPNEWDDKEPDDVLGEQPRLWTTNCPWPKDLIKK
jgi:hypothetical protein